LSAGVRVRISTLGVLFVFVGAIDSCSGASGLVMGIMGVVVVGEMIRGAKGVGIKVLSSREDPHAPEVDKGWLPAITGGDEAFRVTKEPGSPISGLE